MEGRQWLFLDGRGIPIPNQSVHSVIAATAAQSTMSSTEHPRETSLNGRRRPWISGPIAAAPARRSVALYIVLPQLRSGKISTLQRPAIFESGAFFFPIS